MGKIHVLPETIANKIAAGEVVERPASIVKELIENSLDAGATSVEVAIQHGGKSLIRVSDNGSGMSREDAKLAFLRHATSKISSADDLDHIQSFGFRGEALPSISAVSRTKLMTRSKGEAVGTEIVIEGGSVVSVEDCSCREGTILEIRDLFFNTPARRKFMRGDSTEMGHIQDVVANFALAKPKVYFSLKSGDRTTFDLVPVKKAFERVGEIFSEEEAKHMLEIEGEGGGIRITGFVGKPSIARANRTGQIFFVNERWVKSISLGFAVQDGYHGLLMHGQFAVAVLFIEVDAQKVDVNVHPTKQEVRISNEREIKSLISRTITERLQKEGDLAPQLKIMSGFRSSSPSSQWPAKSSRSFVDFLQKSVSPADSPVAVRESEDAAVYGASSFSTPLQQPISLRDKLQITKILGQIHNTFLIAETDEGMMVIDQHAAHERVMFEVLLAGLESGNPQKQRLLMEEVLEVHPRQREIFEQALPNLEKMGFEIDAFGEKQYVIRAYPAILKDENPAACLKEFIEEREAGKSKTGLDQQKEEVAALIACKRKSVKAHDPMTMQAIQTLLERLAQCENPFNCPHGRPTFFKHTFSDLERQFKRK